MAASLSPNVKEGPQVFINFRGELRSNFVTHLNGALKRLGINAFIDNDLKPGEDLNVLFDKIEQSTVALAILSSRYTKSDWCLTELVKIKECVDRRTLCVIPIFYKLKTSMVHDLDGNFGLQLWHLWRKTDHKNRDDRILKWDAALQQVGGKKALRFEENSDEFDFVNDIVKHVQNYLGEQLKEQNLKPQRRGGEECSNRALNSIKQGEKRLKQLEEMLDVKCNDSKTRIVGIVGMPGIGKTYLANKLLEELKKKILRNVFIKFGGEESKEQEWLQKTLVKGLLKKEYPDLICANGNALEFWKNHLIKEKVVLVLDNVSDLNQIEPLLENCDWIKEGSRIIITTQNKSLLEEVDCDIYEVPRLNDKKGLRAL